MPEPTPLAGQGNVGLTPAVAATTPPATVTAVPPPRFATPIPTATPVPGTLYVDAAQELGPISPYVYGVNHGPWAAITLALQAQLQALGTTYIRFPGGNWGDENNLTNLQIDQFITMARGLHAEPSISVRLLGGTAEQAAALVQYANTTKGYQVRYWSIGNEPSLYASNRQTVGYDTRRYNMEWRQFAQAMKAVDPSILLVGPDIHQYNGTPAGDPKDASGRDWMQEFLVANGDLVDIVSIHRYAFPADGRTPPTIDDLRKNPNEWDRTIPTLRALIRATTHRDLPVAVTEINSDWTSACCRDTSPDSVYNAIWYADVLGRLIRQRVDIAAYFTLAHFPDGQGLLSHYDVRPTYYTFQMYKHFGNELIYAASDDPDLPIYAARRADGAITVMVINKSAERRSKPLVIDHFTPDGQAEVWLFDATHQAVQMATVPVSSSVAYTFPAQSVSLLVIPGK